MVSAASTTWLFVRIAPSAVKMTPEPVPRSIGESPPPPNQRRSSSLLSSRTVTSICTTLGLTRSATFTNASESRRASACDAWSCGDGGAWAGSFGSAAAAKGADASEETARDAARSAVRTCSGFLRFMRSESP